MRLRSNETERKEFEVLGDWKVRNLVKVIIQRDYYKISKSKILPCSKAID